MAIPNDLTGFCGYPLGLHDFFRQYAEDLPKATAAEDARVVALASQMTSDLLRLGSCSQVFEAGFAMAQLLERYALSDCLGEALVAFSRMLDDTAHLKCPSNAPLLLREPGVQRVLQILAADPRRKKFRSSVILKIIEKNCGLENARRVHRDLHEWGLLQAYRPEVFRSWEALTPEGRVFSSWKEVNPFSSNS